MSSSFNPFIRSLPSVVDAFIKVKFPKSSFSSRGKQRGFFVHRENASLLVIICKRLMSEPRKTHQVNEFDPGAPCNGAPPRNASLITTALL